MRGRVKASLLVAFGLLEAACSPKTDPGSGSGTLTVQIEIDGAQSGTAIDAQIMLGKNPVAGASVVFTEVDTHATATLEMIAPGSYKGTMPSGSRTLKVKIASGDDYLEAQLEGPGPHVITRPPSGALVQRGGFMNLLVQWSASSRADRVEIDPEGIDPILIEGDPFQAEVPLSGLMDVEQSISVIRETSVDLAGGTSGSRMRSRYKVDNRFTLEG
jgi:hypothetical protein